MQIVPRSFKFTSAVIFLPLALSVFGCPQGNQSAGETQKGLKTQTGLASFYGASLHGKKTASGERFDKTDWVAAHPSYPLGTVAKVTNLKNNKSVEVRIIDRGPSRRNRSKGVIIDLSKDAAKELGFIREGRTRVRVDVISWGGGSQQTAGQNF
jgi:rare lipoprotein A